MFQDVFVVGATGRVGRTLVRQIFERGDCDYTRHPNPTRIVGVASSTNALLAPPASDLRYEQIEGFLKNPKSGRPYQTLRDLVLWIVCAQGERRNISFVDATAVGPAMLDFHLYIIKNTPFGLVTANKLPLVLADRATFRTLTAHPNIYGFRCSVMAGAGTVNKILDLVDLGDRPTEISGCFSGTLGYVVSELEAGKAFSDIIKTAHTEGYTEPHPADDLSGLDVARKILILARTAGYHMTEGQICRTPFVPEQYLCETNVDMFLKRLEGLNNYFAKQTMAANEKGRVLRYIAKFSTTTGQQHIQVGLQEVPKGSPLGVLCGTKNKIVIKTPTYEPDFYSVEAPGAGLEITAQNIRRDLLTQLPERIVCGLP